MLSRETLESILETAPTLRIGLLGDLFLDRYLELVPEAREFSVETGLEAYQVQTVRNVPGALGTLMNNLAALGVGQLVPLTVIGDDGHGYDLLKAFDGLPVVRDYVLSRGDRLTPTYTKPLRPTAAGGEELNRLDVRSRCPLPAAATARLQANLRAAFPQLDGLLVLDQISEPECGVVNGELRATLAELVAEAPQKLVLVDSRSQLPTFSFGTLKGNQHEFLGERPDHQAGSSGQQARDSETLAEVLTRTAGRTARPAFCTLGDAGICFATPGGAADGPAQLIHVPTRPAQLPIDIVGAGDSVSCGLAIALLAGATPREAAELGNLVASLTIEQLGTTGTASPAALRRRWTAWYGQQ